jgi:phosphoenolpyruvate carboxylase
MRDALRFLNPDSLRLLPEKVKKAVDRLGLDYEIDESHRRTTAYILENVHNSTGKGLEESILQAANARGFLG